MRKRDIKITRVDVVDVRVPTFDSLLGSDPFHRKPDYSAVVIRVSTDAHIEGWSVIFNIGAGNDWVAYGVRDLSVLLVGRKLCDLVREPSMLHQMLVEHHQLRWLGDGLFRMVAGGLVNAFWDIWAKSLGKPLWEHLCDLPPETIVECIDWRYFRDALTPNEALAILRRGREGMSERMDDMRALGPAAYSTSGWLGLSDAEITRGVTDLKARGFEHFKTKVGGNLDDDITRLRMLRGILGDDAHLMTDANQIWGIDEAIEWMQALAQFRPFWIEEPTARDDVLGFVKIREALRPSGIGVAAGEAVLSPVIFKQMLAGGALSHCQIDATRLGGVNDVLLVILMAKKFAIPVCPHGGGIGLCNMIPHYALWDQIAVAGEREGRFVEYLDFLQDDVFETPVATRQGHYLAPAAPGWGLEMKTSFIEQHAFPDGPVWSRRSGPKGPAFLA